MDRLISPSRCRRLQCMDQLGSVPLSRTGAELLLEVFNQRCERGPILVNINLPVNEWNGVLRPQRLHRDAAGPAHPPRPHPGDERREPLPQAQPGDRHSAISRQAGQRITHRQLCPFPLLQRRHPYRFAADSHQARVPRSLRPSCILCRRSGHTKVHGFRSMVSATCMTPSFTSPIPAPLWRLSPAP